MIRINSYIYSLSRLPSAALLALALGGCSFGDNHSDLDNYIEEVKSRPEGPIEPLPPLRTYEAFVYKVTAKRSPFDRPVEVNEVVQQGDPKIQPDWAREKEYLESFGVDALSMVGTLNTEGVFWVLIKDALGGINRVKLGNYLGKDHGKIVAATKTQIDLVEIVSDGLGGWLQRPRTLKLFEKE
jgi:type IV pilus assembly protein PilP